MLATVETTSSDSPDAAIIWLHGLGADGHDFEPIVPELKLPAGLAVRFVFPHAPVRPVTLNGGMTMRAWFDIFSLDKSGPVDETGIRTSVAALRALIQREVDRGIQPERIVLAGFSQGGVIATFTALTYPQPLAGLMALSTYLPMPASLASEQQAVQDKLPIFLAHGNYDPVLPVTLGEDLRDWLDTAGYPVGWHTYPMQHAVCPEEIQAISQFLQDQLCATDAAAH